MRSRLSPPRRRQARSSPGWKFVQRTEWKRRRTAVPGLPAVEPRARVQPDRQLSPEPIPLPAARPAGRAPKPGIDRPRHRPEVATEPARGVLDVHPGIVAAIAAVGVEAVSAVEQVAECFSRAHAPRLRESRRVGIAGPERSGRRKSDPRKGEGKSRGHGTNRDNARGFCPPPPPAGRAEKDRGAGRALRQRPNQRSARRKSLTMREFQHCAAICVRTRSADPGWVTVAWGTDEDGGATNMGEGRARAGHVQSASSRCLNVRRGAGSRGPFVDLEQGALSRSGTRAKPLRSDSTTNNSYYSAEERVPSRDTSVSGERDSLVDPEPIVACSRLFRLADCREG